MKLLLTSIFLLFTSKCVQSNNIAVIGGGYSGLTSALKLSNLGYDVSIYEKNSYLGGRGNSKKLDNKYEIDIGPSWYWMPDIYNDVFSDLGYNISDYYNLTKLDPAYKIYFSNYSLNVPGEYNDFISLINSVNENNDSYVFFNKSKIKYHLSKEIIWKANHNYLDTFFILLKYFKNINYFDYFSYYSENLKTYFKNEKINNLLQWPVIFVGNNPKTSPSLYSLLTYGGYYYGTFIPDKGMMSVANSLEKIIEKKNIKVFKNHTLIDLKFKNNKINKLCFNNKTHSNICQDINGIVSSIDYYFFEQNLLPEKYRIYSKNYWDNVVLSPNSLVFYLITNNTNINLEYHNFFFDKGSNFDYIFNNTYYKNPIFYITKQNIIEVNNTKLQPLFILIPFDYRFNINETLRSSIFNNVKERLEDKLKLKLNIFYQDFMDQDNFSNTYNSFKGNSFGLANNLNQSLFFKPFMKSKIKNLVFCGHMTNPGPGIPTSMISGITSANLLDENLKQNSIFIKNINYYVFVSLTLIWLFFIYYCFSYKNISYLYCSYLFYCHGKTYFASSMLFNKKKFLETASLYSAFRIVDDYVDNNDSKNVKYKKIMNFIEEFYYCINNYKYLNNKDLFRKNPIFPALIETIHKYNFNINLFDRFFVSMLLDINKTFYRSFDELLIYMDGSAAVIGEFMIEIMIKDMNIKERSRPYAKSLGIAFQLTNMIRDIKEDYLLNRKYIPLDILNSYKIKLDKHGCYDYQCCNFRNFINYMISRTNIFYEKGNIGIDFLPKDYRDLIKFASKNYQSIHNEIIINHYNIFDSKIKVPFFKKLRYCLNIPIHKLLRILLGQTLYTTSVFLMKNIDYLVLLYFYSFTNTLNLNHVTYLQFHILFTLPIISFFLIITYIQSIFTNTYYLSKKLIDITNIVIILSILYTFFWDKNLIENKVWYYNKNTILGTVLNVPIEEIGFFVIQCTICSLVFCYNSKIYKINSLQTHNVNNVVTNLKIIIIFLMSLLLNDYFYYIYGDKYYYFHSIIHWSIPIINIHFCFNISTLINNSKLIIRSVLYCTLLLSIIDKFAIENFIWNINKKFIIYDYTDYISTLPLEEVLFFFMTSVMCIQSYVLYISLIEKIKINYRIQ